MPFSITNEGLGGKKIRIKEARERVFIKNIFLFLPMNIGKSRNSPLGYSLKMELF